MIFCPNNLITVDNATINNGNSAFPIDNMLSDRLNERTLFDGNIVIDLGAATLIDTLAIADSDNAITIEANATDSWGGPSFTKVMSLVSGTDISLQFISETYRYWRITASGVTKIGHAFIGNKLLFPYPRYGVIQDKSNTDIEDFSASGQRYTIDGVQIIEQPFEFVNKTKEEHDRIKEFAISSYRNRSGIFAQTELNLDLFNPYFAQVKVKFLKRSTSERYDFSIGVQEMK